jgi:hypothetical protein
MGCDIHPHIEIKFEGRWEHYSTPQLPRHYALFERIAGVRGDLSAAIRPPSGIPDDLSAVTAAIWRLENHHCHTPTWLGWDDFIALLEWCDTNATGQAWRGEYNHKHWPYLFGNQFDRQSMPAVIEDVRFVCWFDN